MANPQYIDGTGSTRYRKVNGNSGAVGDPDVTSQAIDTIAAGASADLGATTDAAAYDANGSINAHARGAAKVLNERTPSSLGQKTKANSYAVVLASDQDALQLAAGSASIGSVKDNGPAWAMTATLGSSADASSAALDITTLPVNSSKAVIIDDLVFSAAADMVITIKEASGSNLMLFHYKTAMGMQQLTLRNCLRAAVNKKVQISTSASGQIYTWTSWHEE